MQLSNIHAFRATKYISRLLLVVLLLCQVVIFGFNEYDGDDLYSYQWGLRNNGNFAVDRGILASNHLPYYFNKSLSDTMFFEFK